METWLPTTTTWMMFNIFRPWPSFEKLSPIISLWEPCSLNYCNHHVRTQQQYAHKLFLGLWNAVTLHLRCSRSRVYLVKNSKIRRPSQYSWLSTRPKHVYLILAGDYSVDLVNKQDHTGKLCILWWSDNHIESPFQYNIFVENANVKVFLLTSPILSQHRDLKNSFINYHYCFCFVLHGNDMAQVYWCLIV